MTRRTEAAQSFQLDGHTVQRYATRAFGIAIILLVFWRVLTVGLAEGYPASFWISQALNGLVLGGVYALVALGYTLVYGILFMINFATAR